MVLWRVGQQQYKVRYETKPRGLTGVTAAGFLFIFPWIGKGILCKFCFFSCLFNAFRLISFIFCSFCTKCVSQSRLHFPQLEKGFRRKRKRLCSRPLFRSRSFRIFSIMFTVTYSCEIRGNTNKCIGLNSKSVQVGSCLRHKVDLAATSKEHF